MACRQGQDQGQGGPAEAAKGSTAYSLHAVVCHTGNLLGGHYIGYVRYVTPVCCIFRLSTSTGGFCSWHMLSRHLL